ncbi:MAG: hypothetical protein IPP91_19005 [Betaproteobacteria bacterium]|nr:hypothetical protein [Betaproteobacteria bacterium]
MSTLGKPEPHPAYRQIAGMAESRQAIDEVISVAQKSLCIFDYTLDQRGFGSPARMETLRQFLLAGRAHRLRIALHEPELLERHEPRLMMLLRQLPASIAIHRTVGQARNACDPFVLADDHSVWHQQHHDQLRAIVALHSPADASPLKDRFEEIWELSEPAVSSTTTGL